LSEHLTSQSIERFRKGLLSPPELLQAGDHLAACPACLERATGAEILDQVFNSFNADLKSAEAETGSAHLSYEQLAAYVDQRMNDVEREITSSHLQLCHECKEDARDLSTFRAGLNRQTERQPIAEAQPATSEDSAALRRTFGWWQRLRPLGVLAFALLMAVVLVSLFLLSRPRRTGPTLLVQSNPTPLDQTVLSSPAPVLPASTSPTVGPAPQPSTRPPDGPAPPLGAQSPGANSRPGKSRMVGVTHAPSIAEIRIALKDNGGRVTIDGQGQIAGLGPLQPAEQHAASEALKKGLLETPASLRQLIGKPETLLGGPVGSIAFALSSPVGTVVRSERPKLSWQPLAGAASYTVAVFDSDFNRVAQSPPLSSTEWVLPQALRRGGSYSWQVTALKDGKEIVAPMVPAPEARFRILDQFAADRLTRAEQASRNSHLMRGVLAAQAGLLDEAEDQFQALLKANPRAPIARKLLRNVQRLRRPE
jgi:hypothetical protein